MSGFEVAGTVLGAIPIAIELYEFYTKRSETVFKYAEVMRRFVRTLHTTHSRLRNCLQKLLHGHVDDQLFSELLDDPKTTKWSDPEVESKLRDVLQKSYFGYIETLDAIRRSLRQLEILVGLDDGKSKVSQCVLSARSHFLWCADRFWSVLGRSHKGFEISIP
jgi:hypothetical protein